MRLKERLDKLEAKLMPPDRAVFTVNFFIVDPENSKPDIYQCDTITLANGVTARIFDACNRQV